MVVNLTNVLYALVVSRKRTWTKFALKQSCCTTFVRKYNVLLKLSFPCITLFTQVALKMFFYFAVVTFEMPLQKLLCVKMLLANMTTEFAIVKMLLQVTFELCAVREVWTGPAQLTLYFQGTISGSFL